MDATLELELNSGKRVRPRLPLLLCALLLPITLPAQTVPGGWHSIPVPGSWTAEGPPAARNHEGFAWYRAWLRPHNSFFTPHARNLFEESVTLYIRDLAGAHEVYVNGEKIGTGGQFPPEFRSARDEFHRHRVPPGTLKKGLWNEIAIRVYNRAGPGGFHGEAPFIMDYFMECVLEGPWQFRLGDDPTWTGGPSSEKPDGPAFDQFHESNRVLAEASEFIPGPRLPPEESLATMTAADDLRIELLLHEPLVAQPTHFSFDERGRLWVAQYRQYPFPAGLNMISRDKYYRAHYDKVPPPPPHHDRGRDLITIHEDTTGDGWFDSYKVFLDGLNLANAALRGHGGVWIMHTPYLLFYPDADFDDLPDGPPVVHLQGFGLEDTHSVANGLVWGPDGWLYGVQGSTTSSRVTRPGLDAPDAEGVYFEGCMVWRYHPETRAYEIFAEGGGNLYGLELDAQGRLYSGHNGAGTRGWHFIQGGQYLMQGVDPGKFGPPRHPYAFGELPMMRSENNVVRFSHFGAFVEGTALPPHYSGQLFTLDPLHNLVIAVDRRPRGATFETADTGTVLSSGDVGFRPVYIANAPDGSLYIADFYGYYVAHGQHYQGRIDPTTGRIFRLRGHDSPLETETCLEGKNTGELIALLSHPNKWHRQTAVRLLAERKDPSAPARLKELIAKPDGQPALHALWALAQIAGLDPKTALGAVNHPYPAVRKWTVRLAGDQWGTHPGLGLASTPSQNARPFPEHLFNAILDQARLEPDPEVRAQMAASSRRLPPSQAFAIVSALTAHDQDVHDPYIPMLCWWAIETHAISAREELLALLQAPEWWDRPIVFEHLLPRLMRRYALEGRRQDLLACAHLLRLAPSPRHAAQLMLGFEEAYRGRAISGLPDELIDAMAAAGQSPLIVRLRQGQSAAVAEALAILREPKASLEDRLLYTRAFGELRPPEALPVLLELTSGNAPANLRRAALAALSAYDNPAIGPAITELAPGLPEDLRTAALALLAGRASSSRELLQAIDAGKLNPSSLPPDLVDRMRLHRDAALSELLENWFPQTEQTSAAELQRKIDQVESALRGGTGNPYAGEAIYQQSCAACHKLFHKGGNLGPDLTHYQRDNLGTMLVSIINPNSGIREGYQYYSIETKDGRSLSGFLVDRDAQVTILRGLEGEDLIIPQSDIEQIQPMGRSLMPEGLLDGLDDQQLRDLFAYLRISQPITR